MSITFRKSFTTEKSSATDISVSRYEHGLPELATIILTVGADYGRVTSQTHITVEDAKNLIALLSGSIEVLQ